MTTFKEMPMLPESDAGHGGRFVYSTAQDVASGLRKAASTLRDQTASRASARSKALEDFKGHFSEVFSSNTNVAASDASRLAEAFDSAAGYVDQMVTAAHEEDSRRRTANEWVRKHKERQARHAKQSGLLNWADDTFNAEDARPDMSAAKAPVFPPASVSAGAKKEYSHTGEGGVSSGRPSNLNSFASTAESLNSDIEGEPGRVSGLMDDFASQCSWGQVDVSGALSAYRTYVTANENDAKWARTIADAFERAGSENEVSTLSNSALSQALAAAHVTSSRKALSIDPPTAAGAMPSTGYADDPVNTATGNFLEPEVDLGFPGVAAGLRLARMYNSLPSGLSEPGVFGPGWASVLDQHLVLDDDGGHWVKDDGRLVVFPREGVGFGRGVRENYWLTEERLEDAHFAKLRALLGEHVVAELGERVLVVSDQEGSWWAHSSTGAWLGSGVGPGTTVAVHRGADGLITSLNHTYGRRLDVEYVDGNVAVVSGSDGRRVEYEYNQGGHLVRVAADGVQRRYEIDEVGLIARVINAAGVAEVSNTYDAAGRVVSQVSAHGRVSRYVYLPGRVTVVSDEDGTRSDSWIHDAHGRLVGVVDAEGHRASMAYDAHGNLLMFTERDGSVTIHAYDERSRKVRTRTAEGAEITYAYDHRDRVTTVVTASGATIEYEYEKDTDRDPSLIRDAVGGVTRLVWEDGLLKSVVGPTGVPVSFGYDEFGDVVSSTNALGDTARVERDVAGRPVRAISPGGAVTEFDYDGAGNLTSRVDPDGGRWRFGHDAAGRLVSVTDPAGAVTGLEYAPTGGLAATTDPLGRRVVREFDDLGNVAGTVLPDGARWGFEHDALSRLRKIVDPAGGEWLREYTLTGDLATAIDPTGVRVDAGTDRKQNTASVRDAFATTQVKFDEFGRPVRTVEADGTAELISYDAAGNPVEFVDGEGGLTVFTRDTAGRVTAVTSPSGAVTGYEYDACGRPWRATDPLGAVTELVYDADSRVVEQRSSEGAVRFEYDRMGRLVRQVDTAGVVSRYGYDKAGNLTFTSDPWFGTRRFTYNLAGELVSTRNGLGGVTRFEYDERSRLVRITDPSGAVTTRTYTELDQVASETDAAGRVTTATYDAAGRQLSQTDLDGCTTTWTYDAAGREESTSVDGVVLSRVRRDAVGREVVVTDSTRADGALVEHTLSFDRRGLLISHERSGAVQGALAWAWDADGRQASFTDGAGITTSYERDAAGRITAVMNPRLGRAVFERDTAGRLVRSVAGDLVQEWVYRSGRLVEHARMSATDPQVVDATHLGYDEAGRVSRIARSGEETAYTYDEAGQLASVSVGGEVTNYEYSEGGLLLSESSSAGTTTYVYDEVGQLVRVTHPDGSEVRYVYDGLGRRVRRIEADGSAREYAWGPTGYLSACVDRDADGTEIAAQHLWVDALGQLAQVDGTALSWDTAAPFPSLVSVGETQVVHLPGSLTGIGAEFTTAGWRDARTAAGSDPWAAIGAPSVPKPGAGSANPAGALGDVAGLLPAGVGLTAGGGLEVAGLEWMGARVYDAGTRSFLSTDPLPPTLGAGWDGNPYAYAGNNPLAFSDPNGLKPLTDKELKAYDDSARSGLSKVGSWVGDNWEYFAAGAAIVAGVALMCTGVGGPAGIALMAASGAMMSGGISIATQKATTGAVDWTKVGVDSAIGLVSGGAGAGTGAFLAGRMGTTLLSRATVGAASGAVEGGTSGAAGYALGPGPHTAAGLLQSTAVGAATGGATGGTTAYKPKWLSKADASTFKWGIYRSGYSHGDVNLYRAGDTNKPWGNFWSVDRPQSVQQVRMEKAVLPEWPGGGKSPLTTGYEAQFPSGTPMYSGRTAPQTGLDGTLYPGGGNQVLVGKSWEIGTPVDSWPLPAS